MGTNKKDVTIEYNRGNPRFNPAPGSTELDRTDTLTVKMVGFPAECEVAAVKFFHDQAKATHVGNWTRQNGNDRQLNGKFNVTSGSASQAIVEDTEDTAADDAYWFSVVMDGPEAPEGGWLLDPEVINKKRR